MTGDRQALLDKVGDKPFVLVTADDPQPDGSLHLTIHRPAAWSMHDAAVILEEAALIARRDQS